MTNLFPNILNGAAFHLSAQNKDAELKSYCQQLLTNLFYRTNLQAMLTFFTEPNNLNNSTLKTRSGGKAGYMPINSS